MGFRELLRPLVRKVAADLTGSLVSRLDPQRWTLLTAPDDVLAGPVFGRRFVDHLGVLLSVALRPDGSYRLVLVPMDEPPLHVAESVVRAAFVQVSRRPAVRGHAFLASPVYPALCAVCAGELLPHERAWAEEAVARAAGPKLESRVYFAGDQLVVVRVEVRPVAPEIPTLQVALVPGAEESTEPAVPAPAPRREWRELTWAEEQQVKDRLPATVRVVSLRGVLGAAEVTKTSAAAKVGDA